MAPPIVYWWGAAMAAFVAGALWFALAEDRRPWVAPPPMPPGWQAPAPLRPIERPDIAVPDPAARHDALFNNSQF